VTLTVLSVGYSMHPTGDAAVGGAEQVLTLLDGALTSRGARSIVVACQGSSVSGTRVSTPCPPDSLDDLARERAWSAHAQTIRRVLDTTAVDLVHMHGFDFHGYLPPPGVPTLVTAHLPPAWYPRHALAPARPETQLQCVSSSQRAAWPRDLPLPLLIANGIPVERYALTARRRNVALALGRICPEKGFHLALDAARLAGIPMLLAGQVFGYQEHRDYFAREIAPRLDRRLRFIGPVDFRRKRRLLAGARCLLVPSLAPETSSLVAMEALAAGTPVIAFKSGALPDIVDHGRTGFLVSSASEMADAIAAADRIDPEACRAAAHERFSAERMIAEYFALYERLGHGWSRAA
jgi:glycosyltransferase involved in cell wall biosynthesis